jgi:hypothetical protein
MPPLLLIVGSTELLLDDSVRVAHRCPSAQLLVWHGMPHVFPGFEFLPEARVATQRIGHFVRECVSLAHQPQATAEGHVERPLAAPTAAIPAPQSRPPRRLGEVAWLYLALAIVAGLVSLAVIALWLGPALVWANPVVWAASIVAVVFMLVEAGTVGWRRLTWPIGATVLLGPGCGLSVFLFLRASRAAGGGRIRAP